MPPIKRILNVEVLGTLLLLAGGSPLEEMPVPAKQRVAIFLKVLTFDRRIAHTKKKDLLVAILYQSGFRGSVRVKDQVEEAFTKASSDSPAGRALKLVVIDADREPDLAATLRRLEAEALYVTPLRALDIATVINAARRTSTLTLTGVPEYVEAGLSIGLTMKQDKPQILVNLEASRAEGADLAAPLLKLATIVSTQ